MHMRGVDGCHENCRSNTVLRSVWPARSCLEVGSNRVTDSYIIQCILGHRKTVKKKKKSKREKNKNANSLFPITSALLL